jgi:hypothetical protein
MEKVRWISERSSGYAGFRCTLCGTWRYASEFLKCDCDKIHYIITGPIVDEEQTYWHNDHGWITELPDATTFPVQIVNTPLPEGATGLMKLTFVGDFAGFLQPLPR